MRYLLHYDLVYNRLGVLTTSVPLLQVKASNCSQLLSLYDSYSTKVSKRGPRIWAKW